MLDLTLEETSHKIILRHYKKVTGIGISRQTGYRYTGQDSHAAPLQISTAVSQEQLRRRLDCATILILIKGMIHCYSNQSALSGRFLTLLGGILRMMDSELAIGSVCVNIWQQQGGEKKYSSLKQGS